MIRTVVLDSTPLALLAHRPGAAGGDACKVWAASTMRAGVRLVIPELADYEVRRELTRKQLVAGLARLDQISVGPLRHYLPITTAAMKRASELWADVRNRGMATADPKELDGDAIIAAQVLTSTFAGPDTIVATSNVSHLSRFLAAADWATI